MRFQNNLSFSTHLDRLKIVYQPLVYTNFAQFLIGLIIIALFLGSTSKLILFGWFAFLSFSVGYGIYLNYRFFSSTHEDLSDLKSWENKFFFAVLLAALSWGAISLLFYPFAESNKQNVIALCIIGIVASSISAISGYFRASLIFIPLTIVPLIISTVFLNESYSLIISTGLGIYFVISLMSSRSFNLNIIDNLILKEETREKGKKLLESEEKYRILYEKSEDSMMLIRGRNIAMANQAAVKIFGCDSFEQLVNTPLFDLFPDKQIDGKSTEENAERVISESIKSGHYRFEWLFLNRKKEVIPSDATLTKIEFKGKTAFLCVARDISSSKKLEQDLIRANNAKSEFLANMSHEIRTPMNGVIGINDVMLQNPLEKEQLMRAKLIKSSSQLMLSIINDILDYSKLEAGKLILKSEQFNLDELLKNFSSSIANSAKDKGIDFNYEMPSYIHKSYKGDPGRITQVITNLVSNAIKFTEEGGVQLRLEALSDSKHKTRIEFKITDTGVGINQEQQANLFERFTQADTSTKRNYGGTGLGLSISKQLVDLMGGDIGFHSVEGQGSEFWFVIGLIKSHKTETFVMENNEPELVSEFDAKILIVDDNSTNLLVAKSILEMFGVSCDTAIHGEDAIESLLKNTYDLVFMDCHMPVMDGYEATQAIRDGDAGQKSKTMTIIAMTASAMPGDREKCINAGMNDYLAKPIDSKEVNNMLNRWLST